MTATQRKWGWKKQESLEIHWERL